MTPTNPRDSTRALLATLSALLSLVLPCSSSSFSEPALLSGCPCRLDASAQRLTCSGLAGMSLRGLCADGPGFRSAEGPSLEAVRTVAIVDSSFANFSFGFLSELPNVRNITLRGNTFEGGVLLPGPPGAPSSSLRVLDVGDNNLQALGRDVLRGFPELKILDLSANNISVLDTNLFMDNKGLREIYMHDNPFWCHEMEWFLDWVKTIPELTVHDRHRINCTYYEKNTNFGSVTFESLIDHCPMNCTCNKFRAVIKVYCQNKGYKKFPTMLPDTSSVLHMENNQIDSLVTLVNGSNYITVRFLYVDNNSIDSINILERTDFFNELNSLHISGNRLTQLPTHMIDRMMSVCLDEVKLGNNPWNCECSVVAPFHNLLIKHYQKFKDIEQIRCASDDPDNPNEPIHKLSKHDFCYKVKHFNPFDILNVFIVAVIVSVIAKMLYDYYSIKHTGRLPAGPFNWFPHRDRR